MGSDRRIRLAANGGNNTIPVTCQCGPPDPFGGGQGASSSRGILIVRLVPRLTCQQCFRNKESTS